LIDQLKPGGRLIAPVGVGMQDLTGVDKAKDGKTTMRSVLAGAVCADEERCGRKLEQHYYPAG
jgi:protein-L-isoaspartate O-methyltransferase